MRRERERDTRGFPSEVPRMKMLKSLISYDMPYGNLDLPRLGTCDMRGDGRGSLGTGLDRGRASLRWAEGIGGKFVLGVLKGNGQGVNYGGLDLRLLCPFCLFIEYIS